MATTSQQHAAYENAAQNVMIGLEAMLDALPHRNLTQTEVLAMLKQAQRNHFRKMRGPTEVA